ncbi:hypothetical protein EX895_002279 [Sporisorium graminicola]|uniref:Uracil-DNA glycosylase-like domain-containing protein n=1 Tax=Sporisorium graminicola TaxID=280036 RepID=A0A4U7KYY7_9BASI|nr:hypothetical protein EX895_002279 [Sporisorium graminicola]TKY88648.1 hypothetical protein EX895_002279 [Sporisorium graminicola]
MPSTSLRRSPRARQARFANLPSAHSDIDDDDPEAYQPRSQSASPSKKRNKQVMDPKMTERDALHGQNGVLKNKSRKRIKRTRDDPNSAAGSIYAHLKGLPDLFADHNDIMFCGINPGVKSSHSGHHFAHRSNHFYPSLHIAGITEQRMKPEQDVDFPSLRPFSLGLTNLAPRPTAEGNELLPSELIDGVPVLLDKIQKRKPRTVCFVGKAISEAFIRGLRQAGAINGGFSAKKKRDSQSASGRTAGLAQEQKKKLKDNETSLGCPHIGLKDDKSDSPNFLRAAIPADILRAFATAVEIQDAKPSKGSSPQRTQKQLYTKGNAKDDSGYGILPICVPHSCQRDKPLSVDQTTFFFVMPSSSARVTTHFLDDKGRILKSLRRLVEHLHATEAFRTRSSNNFLKEEDVGDSRSVSGTKLESDISRPMNEMKFELVDVSRFSPDESAAISSAR